MFRTFSVMFDLMTVAVSKFGLAALIPLAKLVGVVYLAMFAFVFVIFGSIARWVGVRLFDIIRLLREELILAYSTASSETVLPRLIEKMQGFGVPRHIVAFVIPTGYSFNLDGSTLYQSIAAIFLAQLYGIDRIMDMARTVVNVVGNALASIVISRWEGQFRTTKAEEISV